MPLKNTFFRRQPVQQQQQQQQQQRHYREKRADEDEANETTVASTDSDATVHCNWKIKVRGEDFFFVAKSVLCSFRLKVIEDTLLRDIKRRKKAQHPAVIEPTTSRILLPPEPRPSDPNTIDFANLPTLFAIILGFFLMVFHVGPNW